MRPSPKYAGMSHFPSRRITKTRLILPGGTCRAGARKPPRAEDRHVHPHETRRGTTPCCREAARCACRGRLPVLLQRCHPWFSGRRILTLIWEKRGDAELGPFPPCSPFPHRIKWYIARSWWIRTTDQRIKAGVVPLTRCLSGPSLTRQTSPTPASALRLGADSISVK